MLCRYAKLPGLSTRQFFLPKIVSVSGCLFFFIISRQALLAKHRPFPRTGKKQAGGRETQRKILFECVKKK